MGHMLEPVAAYWYAEKTGNTVTDDTGFYQHADHPYALANIDRRFEEPSGMKGVLECKSTTYPKAHEWYEEAIPVYYEFQLRYYIAVMDVEIGYFSCLWGNNPNMDLATPRIFRDKDKKILFLKNLTNGFGVCEMTNRLQWQMSIPRLRWNRLLVFTGAVKPGFAYH